MKGLKYFGENVLLLKPLCQPLPFKPIPGLEPYEERVLFFDPSGIYSEYPVNVFTRAQKALSFALLFPQKQKDVCACGCGQTLSGRKRRWASPACTEFALSVWRIIDGQPDTIKHFIKLYNKGTRRCEGCNRGRMRFELDHKIPVHAGGGGCWLNNYQRLCRNCHKEKTMRDLNSRRRKEK